MPLVACVRSVSCGLRTTDPVWVRLVDVVVREGEGGALVCVPACLCLVVTVVVEERWLCLLWGRWVSLWLRCWVVEDVWVGEGGGGWEWARIA